MRGVKKNHDKVTSTNHHMQHPAVDISATGPSGRQRCRQKSATRRRTDAESVARFETEKVRYPILLTMMKPMTRFLIYPMTKLDRKFIVDTGGDQKKMQLEEQDGSVSE